MQILRGFPVVGGLALALMGPACAIDPSVVPRDAGSSRPSWLRISVGQGAAFNSDVSQRQSAGEQTGEINDERHSSLAKGLAGQPIATGCLDTSSAVVPKVDPSAVNNITDIHAGQVYDFRGITLEANPPNYPIVFRDPPEICVTGMRAVGRQSDSLTWRQMKNAKYGGILFRYITGRITFEYFFLDHLMDGFVPRSNDNVPWLLRHGYMRHIRDDAIENDNCLPGQIEGVLVDGAFMFLSVRPGAGNHNTCTGRQAGNTVTIQNTLVRLECQPHAGDGTNHELFVRSCPHDTDMGVGQLFKMAPGAGPLKVSDSIFLVPSPSVNGPRSMNFPPGVYENVDSGLAWRGHLPR